MSAFDDGLWEDSWTYIKTAVDVVREPVLILDKDLRVMAANDPYYRAFNVRVGDTDGQLVYELGSGQWNIPALRELLESIVPENTFFKGFEVSKDFSLVGHKVMILNARRIYKEFASSDSGFFPPVTLLAMEDITDVVGVAEMLAKHTKDFEETMVERTQLMEFQIAILEKEIIALKNKPKNL